MTAVTNAGVQTGTEAWRLLSTQVASRGGIGQIALRTAKWIGVGFAGLTAKKFWEKSTDAIYDPFFERWINWLKLKFRRLADRLHLTKTYSKVRVVDGGSL